MKIIIPELSKEKFQKININKLEFSFRARNILERSGIETIEELYAIDIDELKTIKGCGQKTIDEINDVLMNPYIYNDKEEMNEVIKIRNRYLIF